MSSNSHDPNEPKDPYWRPGDVDGNSIPVDDSGDSDSGDKNRLQSSSGDLELGEENAHPYDALTPDLVLEAVESTGRITDARMLALNSYENRVYQIGLEDNEPIVAKFYRPNRWSKEQIQEEHDFTFFLDDCEVPVVTPIKDEAGKSIFEYGGFWFALYPRKGGRPPELDNLEHLKQLGQFVGRIHAAGSRYEFKYRQTMSIDTYSIASRDYLLSNGFIPPELKNAYEAIAGQIIDYLLSSSFSNAKTICLHGDCHPGNILWRDDRPHFLDFDDAVSGPAIQDLWMFLSGSRDQRLKQLEVIVEGYEVFQRFDQSQLVLIEPLRAMRVLHYNAWLARRWSDPAFPKSFPWFNTQRYWSEHILELKELMSSLRESALELSG